MPRRHSAISVAVTDGELDPDDPRHWQFLAPPWAWRRKRTAPLPADYTVSATVLRNVIPVVYCDLAAGLPVTGLFSMWYPANPYVVLGYTFAWGEIGADLTQVTLDDQDPDDLDWVLDWAVFRGSAAQNPWSTWSTNIPALAAKPRHTGEVFLAVLAYRYALPTIPAAKARMTQGRLVTDYRTGGSSAGGGNPALYAHDILTDSELGLAVPTASVDAGVGGSWRSGADHYDENPGDGSTRYAFHGAITRRDPYAAAAEILTHGGYSELVYFEDTYRLRTRECVVPRADVAIGVGDWLDDPKVGFVKDAPNQVIVKYKTPDGTPGSAQPDYPAFVTAENAIPEEISLSGCVTLGHALRMATKRYNSHVLENVMAKGYVPAAIVADVVKGDIIPVSEPQLLLDETPCWVEELRKDGIRAYVELLRYDDDTDSDVVAVDDDPLWDPDPIGVPVPPTSCTVTLLLIGPWESNTLLPDADDLTATGWVDGGGHDVSYVGGGDYSILKCDDAAPGDFYAVIDPGTAAQILLTLCIALHEAGNVTDPYDVWVHYQSRPTAGAWVTRGSRQLYPNASVGRFLPWVGALDVYQADDEHRVVLDTPALAGGATATAVRLKRLFALPWSEHPEERPPDIDLRERWSWVEGAGADATVEGYRLIRKRATNPAQWEVVGQAPRPETTLEVSSLFVAPGSGGGGPGSGGGGEGASPPASPIMTFPITLVARGLDGTSVDAPDPTQTFRGSLAPTAPTNVALQWIRNRDRRTAGSDDASAWTQTSSSIVVTTDVDDAPTGLTTADRLDPSGVDQIQINDYGNSSIDVQYFQLVWLKSEGAEFDLHLKTQRVGATGCQSMVRVRSHWRLVRLITPYPPPPPYLGGPALDVDGTEPTFLVAAAISWPNSEYDTTHQEHFRMTWTPALASDSVDGYELQYRTYNMSTAAVSDWITWIRLTGNHRQITWGNGGPVAVNGPHFPEHWNNGLTAGQKEVVYDWRVVVVRGGLYTELVPTTVQEVAIGATGWTRQAGDVDMDGIADGETLAWNAANEMLEPAVRVAVSGAPTAGNLAEFTDAVTVEDAGVAVADLAAAGHDHDSDYISVIASPVAGDFPEMTAGGELAPSGLGPGDFLRSRAAGTKSGFNLTGTAFEIATWSIPAGQQHDGGKIHVQVGVTDATDDKAQSLTSEWIWQIARKGAALAITVYQLGTPNMASPDIGSLVVALNVATFGSIKVTVTSSISGGSAPVGDLTWWMTGTGVATIKSSTPA